MKKVVLFSLILFFYGLALAAGLPVKDVSVSIIIPGEINVSEEYSRVFRLVNHNSVSGENDGLLVNINFNVTMNGTVIKSGSVNRSLNSYTETGMGVINMSEEGNYILCARIQGLNYEDPNPGNDEACLDFKAIYSNVTGKSFPVNETIEENVSEGNETINESITEPGNETLKEKEEFDFCSCETSIITDKKIYEKGERIDFSFDTCNKTFQSYPHALEYWVEDLHGLIVKSKLNTTNPSPKRYTPRFEGREKSFLAKAWFPECNNTASPALVVFRETGFSEEEPFLELGVPENAFPGEAFFADVEGFKGETGKTLISLWVEKEGERVSGITKTYVHGSNTRFKQRIPLLMDKELSTGLYFLAAEGLDLEAKEPLFVEAKEKGAVAEETGIKNFYTRKINFDEEINVFVTTSNAAGLLVKVTSMKGSYESYVPRSNSVTIEMGIGSPAEVIVAELIGEDGEVISSEALALNLSFKEEQKKEEIVLFAEPEKKGLETQARADAEEETGVEAVEEDREVFQGSFKDYWLLAAGSAFIVLVMFGKDAYKRLKNKKFFK